MTKLSEKKLGEVKTDIDDRSLNLWEPSSPWLGVYWFSRMLLNTDQYAGVGKDSPRVQRIGESVEEYLASVNGFEDSVVLKDIHSCIREGLLLGRKEGSKVRDCVTALATEIERQVVSLMDAKVFAFTCQRVIPLANEAVESVPSNDREFTETAGRSILEDQGSKGLKIVINQWDEIGVKACLDSERSHVLKVYRELKNDLAARDDLQEVEIDIVLTAFVQELERRLGQKRKGRGGRSLEDVTSLILGHFGFKFSEAPAHFQADIEVDRWIRTKRDFYVGISCKRTLRERWKQVSSADLPSRMRHKIVGFIHVVTHSRDLSDEKLSLLGSHGHIFYLPDEDPTLVRNRTHSLLSKYLRPMSEFINDLKEMRDNN